MAAQFAGVLLVSHVDLEMRRSEVLAAELFDLKALHQLVFVRLADLPHIVDGVAHQGSFHHFFIKVLVAGKDLGRRELRKSRMDVADAALYLTVVAEAKKAFVLADKSLVIIESFFEAGSDADDVPVVGDLALADGVVGLDADRSSSKLLDRDWRGGRRGRARC